MVVHDWRDDVGCLTFPAGLVQFFFHPHVVAVVFGVGIFAVLPVGAPAGVRAFYDVYQALTFAGVVAVVVGGDEVSVFVKSKFVGIAQAGGENFKIAAVGIGTGNNPGVGVRKISPIHGGDVGANVANVPINPAIRAFGHPRHPVSTESDVYRVSIGDGGFFTHFPFFIIDFPEVRCNGDEDVLGSYQKATRYIGHFGKKVVQDAGRFIGHAVAILVFEAPDFIPLNGQVAPIV